jgi:hypothetical protein
VNTKQAREKEEKNVLEVVLVVGEAANFCEERHASVV